MDTYQDFHQPSRQQQWAPQIITTQPPPYPQYFPSDARATNNTSLSLNLSSLSVTSPTNPSPIAQTLSPATPISPIANPFSGHNHQQQQSQQPPFQFDAHQASPSQQSSAVPYDEPGLVPPSSAAGGSGGSFDRRPIVSRSSSSSSLPRKRSITSNAPSTATSATLVEESMFDESRDTAMELASSAGGYDDMDMRHAYGTSTGGGTSPVDNSGSNSGAEDALGAPPMSGGVGASMNVLGKPMATNNFVTKLYQMINDPKSAHFISWTELGTSFVVSNVGEFSRSILGSHFKHNNFSSFVRQLNMYGFHKINRTPRAQRTSTDAQTWEFSHHKFLRGRPDLLDEIKRKALEPDPAIKHRVELPGEVAAQLNAMRDENRRMADQLSNERKRVDSLVNVVGRLWDVMNKTYPGSVGSFPQDLADGENPNIYITGPSANTSRGYPPPLSMNLNNPSLHAIHSHMNSPNSSPTTADFPTHHQQHPHSQHHQQLHPQHSLSRQHSFQHLSYARNGENMSASSTPQIPGSPGSGHMDLGMDEYEQGRGNNKRPRLSNDIHVNGAGNDSMSLMSAMSSPGTSTAPNGLASLTAKKSASRARSDSAPLGYALGSHGSNGNLTAGWGQQGVGLRPRSGSGMGMGMGPRIPNINNMTRGTAAGGPPSGNGTPLLSIATVGESGLSR